VSAKRGQFGAEFGSGKISLNGAAARKATVGDLLIIAAYSSYSEEELKAYQPTTVLVDERNRPKPLARE
jgi:aspartate 1-decarboxylase